MNADRIEALAPVVLDALSRLSYRPSKSVVSHGVRALLDVEAEPERALVVTIPSSTGDLTYDVVFRLNDEGKIVSSSCSCASPWMCFHRVAAHFVVADGGHATATPEV